MSKLEQTMRNSTKSKGAHMILATSVPRGGEEEWSLLRSLGFTLFQTDSEHLSTNEAAPGMWDWRSFDNALATTREHGGKWMFFPHFCFPPPWYRTSPDFARMSCLEHHQTVEAWSLWCRQVDGFFDRGYRALADQYGTSSQNIYAFYIGIHGDYGECMYPAACRMGTEGQKRDWIERFGDEHNHVGYWCGDEYARRDFARFLGEKYGTVPELNRAWGSDWVALKDVEYPTSPGQSHRAWLDFVQWYYDSMSEFMGRVLGIARRHFPDTLMMIPMGGGDEDPRIGQDNTRLPKIVKSYGVRARSTHGGFLPFPRNYVRVKRIATACRFYGVPFWTEPPSRITAEGEVARFFEAISCASEGYWDWAANPLASPEIFRKFGSCLTVERPIVDVAVFFPQTSHRLDVEKGFPEVFEQGSSEIREVIDWDILDENLIADGALENYRVLILFEGNVIEASSLMSIRAWIERGGILLAYGFGPIATVEGDLSIYQTLLGIMDTENEIVAPEGTPGLTWEVRDGEFLKHVNAAPDKHVHQARAGLSGSARILAATHEGNEAVIWAVPHGKGYVVVFAGSWQDKATYYELIRDVVYNASALDARLKDATTVDNAWDGVFATLFEGGKVLFFNPTRETVRKTLGGRVVSLDPISLAFIEL